MSHSVHLHFSAGVLTLLPDFQKEVGLENLDF